MQDRSKPRRRHSAQFKAEVLQACAQSGASTAAVALAFGLNANLVRQWRRGRGVQRAGLVAPAQPTAAIPRFIPLQVEEAPTPLAPSHEPGMRPGAGEAIEVQLQRGALAVSVRWPAERAAECARLLRELLR